VLSSVAHAQHFLIKRNGEILPFKKIKWMQKAAELTVDKKEKVVVDEREIFGYFDGDSQNLKYKKSAVSVNEKPAFAAKRDSINGFNYLIKGESGRINLYKDEVVSGSAGYMGASGAMTTSTTSVTYYYYAEKGAEFKNILITGLNDKKDDLLAFKSFFYDDS
jgi:hypothetical protein